MAGSVITCICIAFVGANFPRTFLFLQNISNGMNLLYTFLRDTGSKLRLFTFTAATPSVAIPIRVGFQRTRMKSLDSRQNILRLKANRQIIVQVLGIVFVYTVYTVFSDFLFLLSEF